ncbi:MAG: manganese efflux pump [Clostridiales bacterium]|nr:manganese efflux pump [Clostridiales bacterium]
MDIYALLMTAIGLAMDAFALSVCKGLSISRPGWRHYGTVGLWFGGFQALMPVIGYLAGNHFVSMVRGAAPWIAFFIMEWLGVGMLREALTKGEARRESPSLAMGVMAPAALAVSVDALAAGLSFSWLQVNLWRAVWPIGMLTALLSMAGLNMGSAFGRRWERPARIAGGCMLALLGVKILAGHCFFPG